MIHLKSIGCTISAVHRHHNKNVVVRCTEPRCSPEQHAFTELILSVKTVLDEMDHRNHIEDRRMEIKHIFPSYGKTVDSISDERVLEELSHICVMHSDQHLKPRECLLLRRTVMNMLVEHTFTSEELTFLNHMLHYYGCMDDDFI